MGAGGSNPTPPHLDSSNPLGDKREWGFDLEAILTGRYHPARPVGVSTGSGEFAMRMAWLGLCTCAILGAAGCKNPYAQQAQALPIDPQQLAAAQRAQELQSRMATLDQDNQELGTLLAQSRQQSKLMEDQVSALREQLSGATAQMARMKDDYEQSEQRSASLASTVKRKTGATITANSSLRETLPTINVPGVEVRQDGDVVRIELPGNQLFESGNARLLPQAIGLIDAVAAEVTRVYPQQIIGVEGHTDSDPIARGPWSTNHQLAVGRAMAVYDQLVARTRLQPAQLFVVGHGANHPVVSNGTSVGKERNRRVELVIYPEKASGRE